MLQWWLWRTSAQAMHRLSRLDTDTIQPYGCIHADHPDFDRAFGALADATRRDIVRRAMSGGGVAELAGITR